MKGIGLNQALVVVVAFVLFGCGSGKECTNSGSPLSSHTLRYELFFSKNKSTKAEALAHYANLIPTGDFGWLTLIPRKVLREENEFSRALKYKMKNFDGSSSNFLKELSLHDVRLGSDSLHWRAQQTNLEYLLMLDVDRLVWSFRRTAGLPTPGSPYGGWEAPDCELRGHFVGHYMSASAQMWASTHNENLKEKMSAVVSALGECQEKMGTGYLSAFPSELFDRFEALKEVWAPYYTIHKILAGILDQYTLGGNGQALKMLTWMVDYFYNRVQNVISKYSIERQWLSLNEETGGMNDVLYNLYRITGDEKHFELAHLFDKPCFLGLLAMQADDISGFHANTHIPIVIGSQMRYEVTGDPLYKAIGAFFMKTVNSSHTYATGGTSVEEFWSDPKRMATTLQTENTESCTTYNMLKVSRNLFRWTKEVAYADYYERALTNGVLSIQRGTDPGVMIYMLPLGHGHSKARSFHGWGTKFDSFWCCYGTGIESFSKLGDSIYFEQEGEVPGLYIIQYISSTLDWKSGGMVLNQKVDPVVSWDPYLRITLTFSPKKGPGQPSTINLRIPVWAYTNGAKAAINSQNFPVPDRNGFLSFTRKWSCSDNLTLQLPITLRTEAIKDDRPKYVSLRAILYGPYLLVGLAKNDWDIQTDSAGSFSDWITPIPASWNSHLISLSQEFGNSSFVFTNSNQSLTMEQFPELGTDASLHATFRLILEDTTSVNVSSPADAIGKFIMLEPMNFPGMVVVEQGTSESLGITNSASVLGSSLFHLVAGLDGKDGTVSLESKIQKDCFIYSDVNYVLGSIIKLKLKCRQASPDIAFNQATSFTLEHGLSEYHPISFVAKGTRRKYLLTPLMSLKDESYTVYFNIQASEGLSSAAV